MISKMLKTEVPETINSTTAGDVDGTTDLDDMYKQVAPF